MKTIQQLTIAAILSFAITTASKGQEQNKFSIYLNMEKDGKSIVVDTTFESREAMESFMKSEGFEVPEAPESLALPPIPDLPELPDMKQIIINVDDFEISAEEKSVMKQEMEEAIKEMEMHKKEMEKAREEMKKIKIEIEEIPEGEHQNLIIRKLSGDKDEDLKRDQDVIIHLTDTSKNNNSEYRIIRIETDKKADSNKQVKVIHKTFIDDQKITNDTKTLNSEKSESDNSFETTGDLKKSEVNDHKLKASDFKIYPNPTQGKINVSFKVEQDGQVQVRILDGAGRVLVDELVEVDNGIFNKEYSIEGKAKGTYLLQLKQGNQWRHEKIIMK